MRHVVVLTTFGRYFYDPGTVELTAAEDSQQYCFELVYHGENNRTYYMGAGHQNEMESWMKALTTVSLHIPFRDLPRFAKLYRF